MPVRKLNLIIILDAIHNFNGDIRIEVGHLGTTKPVVTKTIVQVRQIPGCPSG